MKNGRKIVKLLILVTPVFMAGVVMGNDVAVSQVEIKHAAVTTTVENHGDDAFAADLGAAEELLKRIARQRVFKPKQADAYVSHEMEKVMRFNTFSKTLMPHSFALIRRITDPDALLKDGRSMVARDPASWEGYDFLASGKLLKKDVDGAMENYELALKYAPDLQKDWYRYMLAGCYSAKNNPGKALELHDGVIARNENWVAIKSAYISASMMLINDNPAKAVDYFDKGMLLSTPGEKEVLYKAGVCDKFRNLEKEPEICGVMNKNKGAN